MHSSDSTSSLGFGESPRITGFRGSSDNLLESFKRKPSDSTPSHSHSNTQSTGSTNCSRNSSFSKLPSPLHRSPSNSSMRNRRTINSADIESSGSAEVAELSNRVCELETLVSSLKQLLDVSRHREKKLVVALEAGGGSVALIDFDRDELFYGDAHKEPFFRNMLDRAGWLIGLLVFQSCSSFILSSNEKLLQTHPSIVYYLTMLVGAGGNAGNQATVRVIRELALGRLKDSSRYKFFLKEVAMAIGLSLLLGAFGYARVWITGGVTPAEAFAITVALMLIVFISIITGALLPLLFQLIGVDPANSSTSIQVIMDISGVLITCFAATVVLDAQSSAKIVRYPG